MQIWRTLAGILNLGNIEFVEDSEGIVGISGGGKHSIVKVAKSLQLHENELICALTTQVNHLVPLTYSESTLGNSNKKRTCSQKAQLTMFV